MKVFISSVVKGMEAHRDAAAAGIEALGYEALRCENFGASPASPQQTCLAGLRAADVVVLLLGERYGYRQRSGRSATHEEYLEARDEGRPVLVVIQAGVEPEPDQKALIREVEDWAGGHYSARFSTAADLQKAVTQALHALAVSQASGPLDEEEMLARASALLPEHRDLFHDTLALVVVGGPRRQVLRPAELEDPALEKKLKKEALLGDLAVLDDTKGVDRRFEGNALILGQENGAVLVDELGSIRLEQRARPERDRRQGWSFPAIIEEDVRNRLEAGLRFAGWVLDQLDPLGRLTHVAVAAALYGQGAAAWRTRAEHEASPTAGSLNIERRRYMARPSSARLARAALKQQAPQIAADLTALLRRQVRR